MMLACIRLLNNRENKYDKTFRGNLKEPCKTLMGFLLGYNIESIVLVPPITRQTIVERETDMLAKINAEGKEPFILHLEFQSVNDPEMPERMAVYDYMIYKEYKLEVVSIVVYTGIEKMNMRDSISFNENHYKYQLIDIRDIPAGLFLQSANPREIVFALLAGYDNDFTSVIIKKILNKLRVLCKSQIELLERVKELEILSNLRTEATRKLITKEIQKMPITYDIRKDLRFRQGKEEGKTEGKIEATTERNIIFIKYLLKNSTRTVQEIATAIDVPIAFVQDVKGGIHG